MFIIVIAFGGAMWNLYGGRDAPHIAAPDGAYKIAPPPDAANAPEPIEQNAMNDNLDGSETSDAAQSTPATARPGGETPLASNSRSPSAHNGVASSAQRPEANPPITQAPNAPPNSQAADAQTGEPAGSRPQVAPAPAFAANGPYVAQVAALQSEQAVEPAWRRLSSRAPQLFAPAHLDVERADLGQHGVYFRVRAGYFADRANANRFCDRVKQMGQDCIVVAR
jgi:hypothetical protein